MGEMPEEWKNNLVISVYKEGDKQKLENYRGISLLNECYILHNNILNEKLRKTFRKVPFGIPEWIQMRQIRHRSIVWYEITYRKKKKV